MSIPIPLLMAIEFLHHHDDDRMGHVLRIGVVGADQPLTVEVESDFYKNVRTKDVWQDGDLELPPDLQEKLVVECFEVLWPQLTSVGTEIGEAVLPDATGWIRQHFLPDEAEILLAELRRHVNPHLDIDPNNCTAFHSVQLPPTEEATHE